MADGLISVELRMITDLFKKNLEDANAQIRKLKSELDTSQKSISGSLGKVMDNFKGLNILGITTVGVIGAALVKSFKECLDAAAESEKAVAKLNQVLKATGGAAGVTSEAAQKLAEALQDVTIYDDEAILGGETMLLTFKNIGENIFPRATESMLDIASVMGTDLESAAMMLGKALDNPSQGITAIERATGKLSPAIKNQITEFMTLGEVGKAQNLVLDALNAKMGGSARAAAETYSGRLAQLNNAFGNLKETIGNLFIGRAGEGISGITVIVKDITEGLKKIEILYAKFAVTMSNINKAMAIGDRENYLALIAQIKAQERLNEVLGIGAKLKTEGAKSTVKYDPTKEQEDANTKLLKIQQDLAQKRAQLNKDGLAEINLQEQKMITDLENIHITGTSAYEKTKLDITKYYADQRAEYDRKKGVETAQFTLTQAGSMIGQLGNLFSMYYRNQQMEIDNNLRNQMDSIASGYDAEKSNIEATITDKKKRDAALKALDEKRARDEKTAQEKADKEKRKLVREEAKRNKEISMVQVAINTAMAVMQAVATSGNIYAGIALGVMMAALGAAQMELIRQQPLPALKTGGFAVGPSIIAEEGTDGELAFPLNSIQGQNALSLFADRLLNSIGNKLANSSVASTVGSSAQSVKEGAKILVHNVVQIGSKVLYDDISEATQNGELLLYARAIVG